MLFIITLWSYNTIGSSMLFITLCVGPVAPLAAAACDCRSLHNAENEAMFTALINDAHIYGAWGDIHDAFPETFSALT